MTLAQFTIEDRQNLVLFLDLNVNEVEDGSYLYQRLALVEDQDTRLGTNLVNQVKQRLQQLLSIDNVSSVPDSSFNKLLESGNTSIESIDIEGYGSVDYGANGRDRLGYSGNARSLQSLKDKLISDIKQILQMSKQVTGNRLRSTYPGGGIAPRNVDIYAGTWR